MVFYCYSNSFIHCCKNRSSNKERKFSGFLQLADGLDFFVVFGAVNSPLSCKILSPGNPRLQIIFQIELFRERISQFETGLLAFCYSNCTPFNGVFICCWKIEVRLFIMNRKLSGFSWWFIYCFIVFGVVNSPVVQNTITRQSKASVICRIIERVTHTVCILQPRKNNKVKSFRKPVSPSYLYGNCTTSLIQHGSGFVKLWQNLIKNHNVDSYITCIMLFRREYPSEFQTKESH